MGHETISEWFPWATRESLAITGPSNQLSKSFGLTAVRLCPYSFFHAFSLNFPISSSLFFIEARPFTKKLPAIVSCLLLENDIQHWEWRTHSWFNRLCKGLWLLLTSISLNYCQFWSSLTATQRNQGRIISGAGLCACGRFGWLRSLGMSVG